MKNLYSIFKLFLIIIILTIQIGCDKKGCQSDSLTANKKGNSCTLDNGITVTIPKGALDKDAEIIITRVDTSNPELKEIFHTNKIPLDDFVACIDSKPDGIKFKKPIEVEIPVDIPDGAIPNIYHGDRSKGTFELLDTKFKIDRSNKTITVKLNHFSPTAITLTREQREMYAKKVCEKDLCKCYGSVYITQIDSSKNYCSDNVECEYTYMKKELLFEGGTCPPGGERTTDEEWTYSEECEPNLELSAPISTIKPNEEITITAKVGICHGLENQDVKFTLLSENLGTLTRLTERTGNDGLAIAKFKAGENEGVVKIVATCKASWYMKNHKINNVWNHDMSEPIHSKFVSDTIEIIITDKWSGRIDLSISMDEYKIKQQLQLEYEFTTIADTVPKVKNYSLSGMAKGTQNPYFPQEFIQGDSKCWFENIKAPADLNLMVRGGVLNNNLFMIFIKDTMLTPLFNFDYCYIKNDKKNCFKNCADGLLPFYHMVGHPEYPDYGKIKLEEGTYNYTGPSLIGGYLIDYTVTLKKGSL